MTARLAATLLSPFARFARTERASISVEVVMVLPLLLWGYLGMFTLFDGYRALSSNIRASYTVSDMLSRETKAVNAAYIDGLNDILDVLTQSPYRTVMRVTTVQYDGKNNDYILDWSYSTQGQAAITEANLDTAIVPYLPVMPDGGVLIVVETWMAFVPLLNITLEQLYQMGEKSDRVVFDAFYFESLTTTRPRFAGHLAWEEPPEAGA